MTKPNESEAPRSAVPPLDSLLDDIERFLCHTEWNDRWSEDQAMNLVYQIRELPAEARRGPSDRQRVIDAAYRPTPQCRDCADHDGTCPHDGTKCDPFEAALDTLRAEARRGPIPSDWQSMESAPKDGTYVLLWWPFWCKGLHVNEIRHTYKDEPDRGELLDAKEVIERWASKTISTAGGIYRLVRAAWLVLEELRCYETRSPDGDGHRAGYAADGDSADSAAIGVRPQQAGVHARQIQSGAGSSPFSSLTDETSRAGSEPAESHSHSAAEARRGPIPSGWQPNKGESMQPHQERVVTENAELSLKISKLTDFLVGETFKTLSAEEQDRLERQLDAMKLYQRILSERIAAF